MPKQMRLRRLFLTSCSESTIHLYRRASLVRSELNALRKWQLGREINRVCLPAHVALPRIASLFPPAAGVFLTTESAADLRTARAGVHIGDAAIAPGCTDK